MRVTHRSPRHRRHQAVIATSEKTLTNGRVRRERRLEQEVQLGVRVRGEASEGGELIRQERGEGGILLCRRSFLYPPERVKSASPPPSRRDRKREAQLISVVQKKFTGWVRSDWTQAEAYEKLWGLTTRELSGLDIA